MQELYISDNTIKRARIFLKEAGEIDYVIGKYKGAPTRYWIILKGAKENRDSDHFIDFLRIPW